MISNPKVKYMANESNFGIAYALNQAAKIALKEKSDFLLTMDQDSIADSDLIKNYKNFLGKNDKDLIGMIAPTIQYLPELKTKPIPIEKEVEVAITSGCLLNLDSHTKTGPFKDELFIDYVDFEYCLRLRKLGFKIIQLGEAKIYHNLGQLEKRKFIFKKIYVTHHYPIRYYYRTRNRLFVAKKYFMTFPIFVIKDWFIFLNEFIKILFFEKKKSLKLKMSGYGIFDFLFMRYGKFEDVHSSKNDDENFLLK